MPIFIFVVRNNGANKRDDSVMRFDRQSGATAYPRSHETWPCNRPYRKASKIDEREKQGEKAACGSSPLGNSRMTPAMVYPDAEPNVSALLPAPAQHGTQASCTTEGSRTGDEAKTVAAPPSRNRRG